MGISYRKLTIDDIDIFIQMRINQLREEVAKVEILSLYNILTKLGYKKEELIELVINNLKEMS